MAVVADARVGEGVANNIQKTIFLWLHSIVNRVS